MFNINFRDKNLIVFGGAKGVGHSVAMQFIKHGGKVLICDRTPLNGCDFSESDALKYFQCDISAKRQVETSFDLIKEKFGEPDYCFSSVAFAPKPTPIEEIDEEELMQAVGINFIAHFNIYKYFVQSKTNQSKGVIVSCGTMSAQKFISENTLYSATKAALVALTKSLALEKAAIGLRFHTLCLADMDSPILKKRARFLNVSTEVFAKNRPIKRLTHVDEVANIALFLFSDYADTMTGLDLDITGGRLLI